jgi:hypothetical protein
MPRGVQLLVFLLTCCAAFADQDVIWPEQQRLQFLQRYYASEGADHFLDLWESQNLRSIVQSSGLRDTHTLFVNCHGKAIKTATAKRYVLYPHEELLSDETTPLFDFEDLVRLIGQTNTARIHNIVLSACNLEGALDLAALRNFFPNATNIIHTAAGKEGYQPMLFQMLLNQSTRVETLYERPVKTRSGDIEYEISNKPRRGAKKLSPYVAALFSPDGTRPYRTQTAGRELLLPRPAPSLAALPESSGAPAQ